MVANADMMMTVAVLEGSGDDAWDHAPHHACFVSDAAGLDAICSDAISLAIWRRDLGAPPVDPDMFDLIDDITVELDVDHLVTDLPGLLAEAGYLASSIEPPAG